MSYIYEDTDQRMKVSYFSMDKNGQNLTDFDMKKTKFIKSYNKNLKVKRVK